MPVILPTFVRIGEPQQFCGMSHGASISIEPMNATIYRRLHRCDTLICERNDACHCLLVYIALCVISG